jgi:hypothetical protein
VKVECGALFQRLHECFAFRRVPLGSASRSRARNAPFRWARTANYAAGVLRSRTRSIGLASIYVGGGLVTVNAAPPTA